MPIHWKLRQRQLTETLTHSLAMSFLFVFKHSFLCSIAERELVYYVDQNLKMPARDNDIWKYSRKFSISYTFHI